MIVRLAERARKSYVGAPPQVRKAFDKQLRFLIENLNHPSLHAKKYDEGRDVWQGRINRDWRFYFTVEKDVYNIIAITPHPK